MSTKTNDLILWPSSQVSSNDVLYHTILLLFSDAGNIPGIDLSEILKNKGNKPPSGNYKQSPVSVTLLDAWSYHLDCDQESGLPTQQKTVHLFS